LTLPYERPLNTGFRAPDGRRRTVEMVYLTPGYFSLMKIPLLRGRDILDSDTAEGAKVAVVSESFASKYFHGREVLGQPLQMGKNDSHTIIGVVGDVQQHSGINAGSPLSIEPTVYMPASQLTGDDFRLIHTWFSPKWVVRASGPGAGLPRAIQAAIATADPQLPIARFRTIDDLEALITRQQRYHAVLFSIMAGLALLLAGLGLYGLLSQMVAQRTHEIGVRLALGGTPRQVMASVLKSGVLLTASGAGAGLLISLWLVRLLRHLLWGVRPQDPMILALSTAILFLIAIAATVAPAIRILHVDPAETLRQE
jgi:predicted lysophospholipase L1 biosynthesis ABC-type transport system permease subunit